MFGLSDMAESQIWMQWAFQREASGMPARILAGLGIRLATLLS